MADALIKGITLGFLLSIAVGPILFTIIKQSISNGVKGGLAFVLGVSVSDVCLAIASNFFTELFNTLIDRKELVAIFGSFFLITVGVYFLFFKKVQLNEEGRQLLKFRKRDYARLFTNDPRSGRRKRLCLINEHQLRCVALPDWRYGSLC